MTQSKWKATFDLKSLLIEMHQVFIEASDRFILPRFQNLDSDEIIKSGQYDKVITQADRDSSAWILKHCRKNFPASYSEEETCEERLQTDALWQIDPLDGTHEFKQHHPGFAVQGALLRKNNQGLFEPIAGIIYAPLDRYSIYGGKDIGVFRRDEKQEVNLVPNQKLTEIRISVRQLDLPNNLDMLQESLQKSLKCPVELSLGGGAASSFLQMITGYEQGLSQVYLFPRTYTKEWDLSASDAIFRELGGWISDFEGHHFAYNRTDPNNWNGFTAGLGLNKRDILPLVKAWALKELRHS